MYLFFEVLGDALLRGTGAEQLAERIHAGLGFVLRTHAELHKPQRLSLDAPVADPVLAERLRQLVETEQVFREEGLTIATMAARLDTQEHRLRQLINSQLGFRNFNAFLHHFRIHEARKVLMDPERRHLNVARSPMRSAIDHSVPSTRPSRRGPAGHRPSSGRPRSSVASNPLKKSRRVPLEPC